MTETLRDRFYPESLFGGFCRDDVMVAFYTRIAALLRPTDHVLDFGAGRGAQIIEDSIPYRRSLKTLRGRCAHLAGCDIDREVLGNPFLDSAALLGADGKLPYPSESFDLIYSNWVLEHVEASATIGAELLRVLKPGGVFCAITPNKYGYIALASQLVPNQLHARVLRRVQPARKGIDVFPTRYRMNTRKSIDAAFAGASATVIIPIHGEPAYHFGSAVIYGLFKLLHKITPPAMQPFLLVFVRKRST
jgi:SAM-dependent methyltransferase